VDNPDQRIAEDIRAFTVTTLSFTLILLNAILAVVSFSGVLWTISPLLFGVAVGYAALGSLLTVLLGRRLIGLNYTQSGREADFRAALIHVRENAESVALFRGEARLTERLLNRIDGLVQNCRRITSGNRNLGFFTTGYNALIQIIPALLVAPQFIRGEAEFGVITQSAMAFAQLLGAFSVIVNQFGSISAFGAVIARLSGFAEAVDTMRVDRSYIETREDPDRVAYERLTLRAVRDDGPLLTDLSVSIPRGMRVLITGQTKLHGLHCSATAGIWSRGEGRVVRTAGRNFFRAATAVSDPGTLRQLLVRPGQENDIADNRILAAMLDSGLDSMVQRAGGLDVEHDWPAMLSLGEQQRLVIVRLILGRPSFAMLDRLTASLGSATLAECLRRLSDTSITYVNFDEAAQSLERYDAVLEIDADGGWNWKEVPLCR
jgi:putative ATP-binding cassette transporter